MTDKDDVVAVVHAMYECLSGPAGPRDWERYRTCVLPETRITPMRAAPDGTLAIDVFTPEQYIASRAPLLMDRSFYENETANQVVILGNLAHVLSEYESRTAPDAEPCARGTNSLQLVRTVNGWKVLAIAWEVSVPWV